MAPARSAARSRSMVRATRFPYSHSHWTRSATWPGPGRRRCGARAARARQLRAGRGAYCLFTVKGNQPSLHHQLKALPWAEVPAGARPDRARPRPDRETHAQGSDRHVGLLFPHAAHRLILAACTGWTAARKPTRQAHQHAGTLTSQAQHLSTTVPFACRQGASRCTDYGRRERRRARARLVA